MPTTLDDFTMFHPSIVEEGKTLVLNLQHGKANEMGSACLRSWEAVTDFIKQGTVQSVITTSQRVSNGGKPIFISGADVTERTGWDDAKIKEHVRWQRHVLQQLRQVPAFHVALVHGIAFGWGTEFLLCCDYRISTDSAIFALPETGLGILPGAGGTSELWMEIGVAQALRLGMTGEKISAKEAMRIGLVQENTEKYETAWERALALCKLANSKSHSAIAAFKSALLQSRGQNSIARSSMESQAYEHCVSSGDASIGRANFAKIVAGEPVPWNAYTPFAS